MSFGTFHSVFFLILKLAYRYQASDIVREEQRGQFIREMLETALEARTGELVRSVLSEISMVKGEGMSLDHYYAKSCSQDILRSSTRGMRGSFAGGISWILTICW